MKVRLAYLKNDVEDGSLGKETIKDVFLPKKGYLSFALATKVDLSKVRQQTGIKE